MKEKRAVPSLGPAKFLIAVAGVQLLAWFFAVQKHGAIVKEKVPGEGLGSYGLVTFLIHGAVFFVIAVVFLISWKAYQASLLAELEDDLERELSGTSAPRGKIDNPVIEKARFLAVQAREAEEKADRLAKKHDLKTDELRAAVEALLAESERQGAQVEEACFGGEGPPDVLPKVAADSARLLALFEENLSSLGNLQSVSRDISDNAGGLQERLGESFRTVAYLKEASANMTFLSEEVSATAGESLALMEEINSSIRGVEKVARNSAETSTQTTKTISEQGMMSVVNGMDGIGRIESAVNSLTTAIDSLGARSTDIEKMLSVITDVTEQTQMLSLNAQILAAQAGEHGRGFSVVADETSSLSERSAHSTREIAKIISDIRGEIEDLVEKTNEAVGIVAEGSASVMKIGTVLREILVSSQKSTEFANSIMAATGEQARGLEETLKMIQIVRNMIADVTEATVTEETIISGLHSNFSLIKDALASSLLAAKGQMKEAGAVSESVQAGMGTVLEIKELTSGSSLAKDTLAGSMEELKTINERNSKGLKKLLKILAPEEFEIGGDRS